MEMRTVFKLFLILSVSFRSSSIYAENSDESFRNDTVTYKTTTATSANATETLEGKPRGLFVNSSSVVSSETRIQESESVEADIKPSDEIIISNYKDYDTGKTENLTPGLKIDNMASVKQTHYLQTTTTDTQRPRLTDSIISVRKLSTRSNIHNTVSPDLTSKPASKQIVSSTTTSTVTSSTTTRAPKPSVIFDTSPTTPKGRALVPEVDRKLPAIGVTPVIPYAHAPSNSHINRHVELHTISPQHHIPFRHHLQLVPMEDEPFGAVLLKDQRYIVSVLIPVGVGIIGALVIMVTIYGLRHVAKKHGREFPRVDIEAGRQNIASISSERTDKMLLLDDDEDNDF